jgi:hypothetical protein
MAMSTSFLMFAAVPLLILLIALIGWAIIYFIYADGDAGKEYKDAFHIGLIESIIGSIVISTECKSKHMIFGQRSAAQSWVGYMAIACGIFTILYVIYLIWNDKRSKQQNK